MFLAPDWTGGMHDLQRRPARRTQRARHCTQPAPKSSPNLARCRHLIRPPITRKGNGPHPRLPPSSAANGSNTVITVSTRVALAGAPPPPGSGYSGTLSGGARSKSSWKDLSEHRVLVRTVVPRRDKDRPFWRTSSPPSPAEGLLSLGWSLGSFVLGLSCLQVWSAL